MPFSGSPKIREQLLRLFFLLPLFFPVGTFARARFLFLPAIWACLYKGKMLVDGGIRKTEIRFFLRWQSFVDLMQDNSRNGYD